MNIFIAGAGGRVASVLIDKLVADGHQVLAGARRPEELPVRDNVTPLHLDLHNRPEQLAQVLAGADAVYFTAGSRGKDLLQTDAFGAIKLMQASQELGIKRFIMLSSAFALEPDKWDGQYGSLENYQIAKFLADHWLVHNTDLDYTIVQPGPLTETAETGLIATDIEAPAPNAIANVAEVLAQVLVTPEASRQVITMADGTVPIKEALKSLAGQ